MLNWNELARWPERQLATVDVADVNLACADGLPGSEKIDRVTFSVGLTKSSVPQTIRVPCRNKKPS
jgi:hypothetical protein